MLKMSQLSKSKPLVPTLKEEIIRVLKMNNTNNKFVIIEEQLEEFKKITANSSYFKNFSNWYKFFSQTAIKNLPVLFSPFSINHKNIYDDQVARAKHIHNVMKQNPSTELITMDGPGRLIYSVISEFQKEKSFIKSKRKIHVVDIDETTNEFHKHIFSQKIFRNTINIPDTQDILELNNSFLEKNKISNAFLYLNFCGIGCCKKDNIPGNVRLYNFIKKWLESHDQLMVSLSLRPYGFRKSYKGKITTYGLLSNLNLEIVCQRVYFVTFNIKN